MKSSKNKLTNLLVVMSAIPSTAALIYVFAQMNVTHSSKTDDNSKLYISAHQFKTTKLITTVLGILDTDIKNRPVKKQAYILDQELPTKLTFDPETNTATIEGISKDQCSWLDSNYSTSNKYKIYTELATNIPQKIQGCESLSNNMNELSTNLVKIDLSDNSRKRDIYAQNLLRDKQGVFDTSSDFDKIYVSAPPKLSLFLRSKPVIAIDSIKKKFYMGGFDEATCHKIAYVSDRPYKVVGEKTCSKTTLNILEFDY